MKHVSLLLPFLSLCQLQAAEPSHRVTFADDIGPIVHSKCTMCHREGQPGPFELLTFEDVQQRAETIQAVVHDNYMPPWKPVNDDVAYSNDRRLTKNEHQLIDDWIAAGTPAGDLSQLELPEFSSGWSLGEPDLVVRMNGRFAVPASGRDVYRSFVFPVGLEEDKWVKAVELRPTARGAMHHALFFIDTTGEARRRDGRNGKAGISGMSFLRSGNRVATSALGIRGLGGYVPGAMPNKLPGDLAMLLPKGGDIVMQTHFHPSGKPEWEEAELALYFADEKPSRQMVPIQMPPLFGRLAGIDVPPGEKNFEITQSFTIPVDVQAVQIGGHAHYICREMDMTATLPDGKSIELLTIDDWDLDWQDQYQFREPLTLPKGTQLDVRLVYDNSADNPENPHSPPKRIAWGRESTDEMGAITLQVVAVDQRDESTLRGANSKLVSAAFRDQFRQRLTPRSNRPAIRNRPLRGAINAGLVKLMDRNKDGKLQHSEVPERSRQRIFDFADNDGDGVIDEQEIEKALAALQRG